MQNKASLILKWLTNYRRFSTTNRLPLLGQEVGAISGISLLCFCSGLKFFVQLLFYTFTSVRCWAEVRAKGT